ncbi:hypothetical protein DV736_g4694, partial [Chaetothyriales sp. CBS 134916]
MRIEVSLRRPVHEDKEKSHHVNVTNAAHGPRSFKNPWPSHDDSHGGFVAFLKCRFGRDRPHFVPVPGNRGELVPVQPIDFSEPRSGFKVTWLGHASFLLQCATLDGAARGVNLLFDPVFSKRTSPVSFLGPKRYSPPPCTLAELVASVPIDLVLLSHNHYDHSDTATLRYLYRERNSDIRFIAALGNSRWLRRMGIKAGQIHELDWWDAIEVRRGDDPSVEKACLQIVCTPAQHTSARGPFDRNQDLWCSFALEDLSSHKKVYFSGDTAYRSVPQNGLSVKEEARYPCCPAFKQIGDLLGPFDLAMLPIGLCTPRSFMSAVHCNAWDSIEMHQDIRSKRSIGMHWGTVRGFLSRYYEDVRDPPRRWREAALEKKYKWREKGESPTEEWEVGLLDVGESLVV